MNTPEKAIFNCSDLRKQIVTTYRKASGSRPEVLQVKVNGYDLVVKDYSVCSGVFGAVLGPLLVYREKKALKRLQGIKGISDFYECDSSRILITSHCQASVVSGLTRDFSWEGFEIALHKIIGQMHNRGIVHCDLRSPGNILIDDDNKPHIVDFVASFSRSRWNPAWNFMFQLAKQTDYSAILKIKNNIRPHLLSDKEKQQRLDDSKKGGLFRWVTGYLRRITQWVLGVGK